MLARFIEEDPIQTGVLQSNSAKIWINFFSFVGVTSRSIAAWCQGYAEPVRSSLDWAVGKELKASKWTPCSSNTAVDEAIKAEGWFRGLVLRCGYGSPRGVGLCFCMFLFFFCFARGVWDGTGFWSVQRRTWQVGVVPDFAALKGLLRPLPPTPLVGPGNVPLFEE